MGKKDGFNRAACTESIIASFHHRGQSRHRSRNKASRRHKNERWVLLMVTSFRQQGTYLPAMKSRKLSMVTPPSG